MNQQLNSETTTGTVAEKPTINEQIDFVRNEREACITYGTDIRLYEADKRKREILKAIEENLIAVRLWNLTHADKEEAIGDDQPVLPEGEPMPPGTRCTVELEMKGKSEFVEATIIHWEGMAAGTYRVMLNDGRRLSLKPKNIKWVNGKEPETELDYQGKEAING